MLSHATATWEGGLQAGHGRVRLGSRVISRAYSIASRFEGARGTSPEELMAAAFAAGVTMTITQCLDQSGTPATSLTTKATCVTAHTFRGFVVTEIRLAVSGAVPRITDDEFRVVAREALMGSPVGLILPGQVPISIAARLEPFRSRSREAGVAS